MLLRVGVEIMSFRFSQVATTMPFGTLDLNDGNKVLHGCSLTVRDTELALDTRYRVWCMRSSSSSDAHAYSQSISGTGSVMKGKDVTHFTQQAIEAGFSHLDTAQGESAQWAASP